MRGMSLQRQCKAKSFPATCRSDAIAGASKHVEEVSDGEMPRHVYLIIMCCPLFC